MSTTLTNVKKRMEESSIKGLKRLSKLAARSWFRGVWDATEYPG